MDIYKKKEFPDTCKMTGGRDSAELMANLIRLSGAKAWF